MSFILKPGQLVVGLKPYTDIQGNLRRNHVSLTSIFIIIDLQVLHSNFPEVYKTNKAKEGYTPVKPALLGIQPQWKGKALNPDVPYYEIPTPELVVLNPFVTELPHFNPFLHLPTSFDTEILPLLDAFNEQFPNDSLVEQNENNENDTHITINDTSEIISETQQQ